MALRKVSGRVKELTSLTVFECEESSHKLITHPLINPYKKDSPRGGATRGMLSVKLLSDSPEETCGGCYRKCTDTDSPDRGCYLAYVRGIHIS